jgi:hypothetical protein
VIAASGTDWNVVIPVVAICISIIGGAITIAFAMGSFRQKVLDGLNDLGRRLGIVEGRLDNRTFDGQVSSNGHMSGTIDAAPAHD